MPSGNVLAQAETELDRAAGEISVLARELAPLIESERGLPEDLLIRLRESGLMRAGAPAAVGAPEAPPAVTLRCAETIARGDASAGWCVSIAATSSLLAAYLPEASAEAVVGSADRIAAGVWAPRGVSKPVDGGYCVSGRWAYCSGINHSDHLFIGTVIDTGEGATEGPPRLRIVGVPKPQLKVLDTWHTTGLRGTGSHDVVVDDVFVPTEMTLSLLDEPPLIDAPLYRFPIFGFFALSIGAAALGNARGAIDELVELATGKTSMDSRRTLAERAPTQAAVAGAEASLRAARALYYQAIDEAWQDAEDAGPVAVELRTGIRLAATHAVRTAADVVKTMYDLAGGSAIYDESSLQRRFRDAYTATAHFQVNAASLELPGRLLLGLPTNTTML